MLRVALFSRGQPSRPRPSRTRVPASVTLYYRGGLAFSVRSGNACPGERPAPQLLAALASASTHMVTTASLNCTSACLVPSRLLPRAMDRSLIRLLPIMRGRPDADPPPHRFRFTAVFLSLCSCSCCPWRRGGGDLGASFGGSSTPIIATGHERGEQQLELHHDEALDLGCDLPASLQGGIRTSVSGASKTSVFIDEVISETSGFLTGRHQY
jgi:hypothetical protein